MKLLHAATPRLTALATSGLVALCALVAPLEASGPAAPARLGTANPKTAAVRGMASKADNAPLPGAQVQLRNAITGKIEAKAVADHSGQFAFPHLNGGTYVVEVLGENGNIVTVGHSLVVAPGETVATFVRLVPKTPFVPGFFSNAATSVVSSAANAGVTVIAPVQIAASSGSPTAVKQ